VEQQQQLRGLPVDLVTGVVVVVRLLQPQVQMLRVPAEEVTKERVVVVLAEHAQLPHVRSVPAVLADMCLDSVAAAVQLVALRVRRVVQVQEVQEVVVMAAAAERITLRVLVEPVEQEGREGVVAAAAEQAKRLQVVPAEQVELDTCG